VVSGSLTKRSLHARGDDEQPPFRLARDSRLHLFHLPRHAGGARGTGQAGVPQLRRLCESRGVTWGEVDLRWGVPDEAKAEGKVLPLCLQEIEHCRPYFIGLLGERYGWVPESIPQEMLETQPWIRRHPDSSVTALEILHGVLENPEMEHAETPVLVHFIGAAPDSANWMAMPRRLLGEFLRKFGIEIEISDQPDALRVAFANALHMVAARGRLVLALDALNQIEDREGAPDLVWLPPVIPANVRLVVSKLPGRPWDDLQKRGWPVLTVEPLTVPEREELIVKYLKRYSKELSPEPARRIAAAPQTGNGLYLSTLLNELRQFGSYERLDERIDWYLEAANPFELYGKIIERWEHDCGQPDPACENIVRESLSRLWAARHGLSEAELLESLGASGSPLPRAVWSPLFLAAGDALVNRGGLLTFAHDFLRDARMRYLDGEVLQRAAHQLLANFFDTKDDFRIRSADELLWQLKQAANWKTLGARLQNAELVRTIWSANRYEICSSWVALETATPGSLQEPIGSCLPASADMYGWRENTWQLLTISYPWPR
jgi:hypothetical protein